MSIPELSNADAAWDSRVIGQHRRFSVPLGPGAVEVTLTQPRGPFSGPIVRVLAGDASLWVAVSDWAGLIARSPVAQNVDLAELPAEVAAAVVEVAAESVFAALSKATGLSWSVLEVAGQGPPPFPWRLGLELKAADGALVNGAVTSDPTGLERLASLIERSAPRENPVAPVVPLIAPVEIGMSSLPLAELSRLEERDVVLMDVTAFLPDHHGVVRISPTAAWRVTVRDGKATLVEPRTTTPPVPLAADAPVANVVFQYGELSIPTSAIAGLAAGQVFDVSHSEPIRLAMDGIPFASGDLVVVGSRVGVRLTTLGRRSRGAGKL